MATFIILGVVALVSFFFGCKFVGSRGYEAAYTEINKLIKEEHPIKFHYTNQAFQKVRTNILDIMSENRKLRKTEEERV